MAEVDTTTERSIRTRQTLRIVVWVVLAAVLVVLAVANTQSVAVDWVFDETETSLWVVIAGSAVLGFVLGYVARWKRS